MFRSSRIVNRKVIPDDAAREIRSALGESQLAGSINALRDDRSANRSGLLDLDRIDVWRVYLAVRQRESTFERQCCHGVLIASNLDQPSFVGRSKRDASVNMLDDRPALCHASIDGRNCRLLNRTHVQRAAIHARVQTRHDAVHKQPTNTPIRPATRQTASGKPLKRIIAFDSDRDFGRLPQRALRQRHAKGHGLFDG